jgi:beta-N-acetylhexosaminidase
MGVRAFICGLAGTGILPEERAFLQRQQPWGVILFARNIGDANQLRALVTEIRAVLGRMDAPILIDQEGGRVQRLRPPLAERHPPAGAYAALYREDRPAALAAVRAGARLIAEELRAFGINVDCFPVLDLLIDGAHGIIGDRAYGNTPAAVAELAGAACAGLVEGGVLPIVKHVPGHGRAMADSHQHLPRVDTPLAVLHATDFAPFRRLADAPMAMTAHVVYTALDADRPATLSPRVVSEVIRGDIGFDGLLLTDDLSMKALSGPLGARAEQSFAAGCDIALHCNGALDEMVAVAEATPVLAGDAARRADAALARLAPPRPFDRAQAVAMVRGLLAGVAA